MPRLPLDEQSRLDEAFTADFTVVRALLRCGRAHDMAVDAFEPFGEIKEVDEGPRKGMRRIVQDAQKFKTSAFVFLNNRLEGNAPSTIEAIVQELGT
jgi:hypothetical protein